MRAMRLECQNKYFPYGPKSRLIRALLYTYTNRIVHKKILLSWSVVYSVSALPGPYAGPYAYVRTASQPIRSKNSPVLQSVYNKSIIFKNISCILIITILAGEDPELAITQK